MGKVALGVAVAAALVAAAVPVLCAQPLPAAIAQLDHTVWTVRDGAPVGVNALAQSADGVLWIGTTTGLYQFDGVEFAPYEPGAGQALLSLSVSTLLALPDGGLWVGYHWGGVSSLVRGRLTSWLPGDALPSGTVTGLARDSSGEIWASTTTGLARFRGGLWNRLGAESGYPGGMTSDLVVDRSGAVWAATASGVFVQPRGASRFERRAPSLDPSAGGGGVPRQAPDGSIWASSMTLGLTQLADASGAATPPATAAAGLGAACNLMVDRHAKAWVTLGVGLVYAPLPARTDGASARLRPRPPLPWVRVPVASGDQVSSLLEDREGNVWVGTTGGLDQYRETKLKPVVFPRPIVKPALVSEATNGAEAVTLFAAHRPDVVLIDLRMPKLDGVGAIQAIRAVDPGARLVALTTYEGDGDIHRALSAGACGYLLKDALVGELVNAVRAVAAGKRVIPPAVANRLAEFTPRDDLSAREREVLLYVARGLGNKQIARAIGRSAETMKAHLESAFQKLGARDRTHAVTLAPQRGNIHLDE